MSGWENERIIFMVEESMTGFSVLVPIPLVHFDSAITILDKKEFVAFGSDAYAVLRNVHVPNKLLI